MFWNILFFIIGLLFSHFFDPLSFCLSCAKAGQRGWSCLPPQLFPLDRRRRRGAISAFDIWFAGIFGTYLQ